MKIWLSPILFIVCTTIVGQSPERPNIVIIYVDDMGIGDVSFTGGEITYTPNIDRLAKKGKIFTQYYSNSPVCSPSRAAMLTGMYPLRWNLNTFLGSKKHNRKCDQSDYLKSEAPTIAKMLKSVGYQTAHIGKWHIGGGRDVKEAPSINMYGFDDYLSTWESPDPDPLITAGNWIWQKSDSIKRWDRTRYFFDHALEFMAKDITSPKFVNIWLDDVHTPWVPSEDYLSEKREGYFDIRNLKSLLITLDTDIGYFINEIEKLGLGKSTMLIFTSDNGPGPNVNHTRSNQLRGAKNSLYEGGINMPFFIYWPQKISSAQTDDQSVIAAIDVLPTIADLLKITLETNYTIDGESFAKSLVSSKRFIRNKDIFWDYGRMSKFSRPKIEADDSPDLGIRSKHWKCFTNYDGSETQLYNLKKDPMETKNIADQNEKLANKLKNQMLKWFKENDKSEIVVSSSN